MSRILFVMLHPGFIRYYEGALHALAAARHEVHVAFEISRAKLGEDVTAQRLGAASDRLTCGTTPGRAESVRDFLVRADRSATRSGDMSRDGGPGERRQEAWESLATTVRLMLDYLRFFEPAFAGAGRLRERAEKRLPRVHASLVAAVAATGPAARRALASSLRAVERAIPVNPALEIFVQAHRPDLLLVTPLIELGSQQVDYVKCARRLGIRSALCVASWDNLTSKGVVRVPPDHVIVWNEAQKREAVELHGIAPEQVVVTGAQLFDQWFEMTPTRTREAFCHMVGLASDRPYVLYVGSSAFIAPDEVPFFERWLGALRGSGEDVLAGAGVLIRPHPANARQWRALDPLADANVAVWPPIGTDPNAPDFRRDYFESLLYSDAVVGINTSALIEAAIVDRPVFTVRDPEFAHAQTGTLHFQHLVGSDGAVVHAADTLEEHVTQLSAALGGRLDGRADRRAFVGAFVRPRGLEQPATPIFVGAVEELARMPRPAQPRETAAVRAARPAVFVLARIARALAEDRPLWVYPLRPLVSALVWATAIGYRTRTTVSEAVRLGVKRLRRGVQRLRHEGSRSAARAGKRWKRAQGRAKRALAAASSAHRRG